MAYDRSTSKSTARRGNARTYRKKAVTDSRQKKSSAACWRQSEIKDKVKYISGWFYRKWTGLITITAFQGTNSVERISNTGKAYISYCAVVENKTACTKSNYPAWYCKQDECLYIPSIKLIVNTAKNYTKPMFDIKK